VMVWRLIACMSVYFLLCTRRGELWEMLLGLLVKVEGGQKSVTVG